MGSVTPKQVLGSKKYTNKSLVIVNDRMLHHFFSAKVQVLQKLLSQTVWSYWNIQHWLPWLLRARIPGSKGPSVRDSFSELCVPAVSRVCCFCWVRWVGRSESWHLNFSFCCTGLSKSYWVRGGKWEEAVTDKGLETKNIARKLLQLFQAQQLWIGQSII